jgi:inner membrane protein
MNSTPEPPVIPTPARRRLSLFLKIGGICVLTGLLHIPLGLTQGVLRERQGYQAQATDEIAGIWGRAQLLRGPVLAVPYSYTVVKAKRQITNAQVVQNVEEETVRATAYFFPETLAITGKLQAEKRSRGIYDAVVYTADLRLSGQFYPKSAEVTSERATFDWGKTRLIISLSDLRALQAPPVLEVGGQTLPFESCDEEAFGPAVAVRLMGVKAEQTIEYNLSLLARGTSRIDFAPVARQTSVKLAGNWGDPSFSGSYLPSNRSVTPEGFSSTWDVAHFGRDYPLLWSSLTSLSNTIWQKAQASAFGVQLMQPVSGYSMAERAQKYGVLFFVLIFAVFFLFEMTAALRIHPLQYAMVGAALCLFFLGFLALSEFWTTGLAYGAAAAACTLLVSSYAWSFLKTGRRTLVIGGGLGATYGYLFFVLKSQDYALVAGTAALFAALALVMFCTRRINWYSLEMNAPAPVARQ